MTTDRSKASKPGRLKLVDGHAGLMTVPIELKTLDNEISRPVFRDGVILQQDTWQTIQDRASDALERAMKAQAIPALTN